LSATSAFLAVDVPEQKRSRATERASTVRVLALRWGTVALLVALWEILVDLFLPTSSFFAAPSAIVLHGLAVFLDPSVQSGLLVTAERILIAFAISAVVGVALGLVLGRLRGAPVARNVAVVLYAVPQVAFYPLFVIWFGLGQNAEIAFGVTHGLVPVVLGTLTAATQVDAELLEASRAMGGNRTRHILNVVLPSCLPGVIGALRLGASLSLLGILLGQLLMSTDGVGALLAVLSGTLQPARLDALILGISVAAILINVGITVAQRALFRSRGQS
jgi:NitT/TauT family transport system permease protein